MAEYRGVDNVAREIIAEWRGVSNVARQYFGTSYRISFGVPTSNNKATVTSEYAGFDGDSIRLSFEGAILNTTDSLDPGDYICRMYINDIDSSLFGKTFSFNYTSSFSYNAYSMTCEVQYRDADDNDLYVAALSSNATDSSHSYTIPDNTDEIVIGFWCTNTSAASSELIMTNMYLGEDQIV